MPWGYSQQALGSNPGRGRATSPKQAPTAPFCASSLTATPMLGSLKRPELPYRLQSMSSCSNLRMLDMHAPCTSHARILRASNKTPATAQP